MGPVQGTFSTQLPEVIIRLNFTDREQSFPKASITLKVIWMARDLTRTLDRLRLPLEVLVILPVILGPHRMLHEFFYELRSS